MDGLASRLGMSDTRRPLPQALARPPATHTFSPQSTKYILKKPQHNQAACKGPREARVWPTGAEDRAWGSEEGTRGLGEPFWFSPAEFAVCPLLVWMCLEVPCSLGHWVSPPPPKTAKGKSVWKRPTCWSKGFGGAPAPGDAGNMVVPAKCLAGCPS